MACSSCIQRAESTRKLAIEASVLERTGTLQIIDALSKGGLTEHGFGYYRSLGVAFKTGSPWDEAMNLYRDYPIRAKNTRYYLWVRITTMFGSKVKRHDIGSVPGIPISIHDSEGYTRGRGRILASGKLLKDVPSFSTNKLLLTSESNSGWTGSGVGFGLVGALMAVSEHRKVIDRYAQEHSSLVYSEEESKAFLVPMFSQWKLHATGIDIPDDIKVLKG
ncbi:hypothetical protein [Arthrobacter methylotrophus]|uniref:Uncharacterized protein n=2 Tax=Arthrobacter methylotrophus TaxID=121291 RepID=A0ABV5UPE6_9MICC